MNMLRSNVWQDTEININSNRFSKSEKLFSEWIAFCYNQCFKFCFGDCFNLSIRTEYFNFNAFQRITKVVYIIYTKMLNDVTIDITLNL